MASGGVPSDAQRADGTFAIDWILPYLDQITPDQRAAVTAALAPPQSARMVEPAQPLADVSGLGEVKADADPDKPYEDVIAYAETVIASRLHRELLGHIFFTHSDTTKVTSDGNETDAYAYASTSLVAPGSFCVITATPLLPPTSPLLGEVIAHEVFHCFQYDLTKAFMSNGLGWIIEGQAAWVGEDLGGPTSLGTSRWSTYLASPGKSLFGRVYDAIGFYEHLKEVGIDPWTVFDAMLKTPSDNFAAFKAAGGTTDAFLDTWGSGYFRSPEAGPAWNVQGRWTTPTKPSPKVDAIQNGDIVSEAVAPARTAQVRIESHADVVELQFTGHARMYSAGVEAPSVGQIDLCTKDGPDACQCPPGTTFNGPDLQPSTGQIDLGLSGSLEPTSGTIRGRPMSDFCQPAPSGEPDPRGGPDPCAKGCGQTVGDPHLITLAQQEYDFQAAGEYTLVRSADGSMEVQVRQAPYPDVPDTSINTAFAFKVGDHRVGIYADQGGTTYTLKLDGATVDGQTLGTRDLGGGSALTALPGGIEVAYGDGTIVTIVFHGNGFVDALDATVAPSANLALTGVGLLGSIVAGSELPNMPDGSTLPGSQDRATRYAQRYQQFGPAWHVTDQNTLFDYGPGQSTATFDQAGFPSQDVPFTIDEFVQRQQAAELAQAQQQCAGVQADQTQYQQCIYDVLATKDPAYAGYYEVLTGFLTNGPTELEAPDLTPSTQPTPQTTLPDGFINIDTDVDQIKGATVGADGTLFASLEKADATDSLVSVDPSGQHQAITTTGAGTLFIQAGSLWLAQDDPTGNGACALVRFDPATLSQQASISVGCDLTGPSAVPVTDGIWWVDRSTADIDGHGGMLRHMDPSTSSVDRSVELPFLNADLLSSPSTVIYGDVTPDNAWYSLVAGSSTFSQMTLPTDLEQVFPSGAGVWYQSGPGEGGNLEADFTTGSAQPQSVVPIGDGALVGADEASVYGVTRQEAAEKLTRYVVSGSPTTILSGATLQTADGALDLGYDDNDPLVIANNHVAKLWLVSGWPDESGSTVVAQVASLP